MAIHNLGCKVNSYESEKLTEEFRIRGCEIVEFDQIADIYVVNTCTVTQIADKKSRQMLARARRMNPDAVVAAIGCAVDTGGLERDGGELFDIALKNADKMTLVDRIAAMLPPCEETETVTSCGAKDAPSGRARRFLKVQDGCDQFCSYCVIPYARGRTTSRDPGEILTEAAELVRAGAREIVLTGIHLSSFGRTGSQAQGFDSAPLTDLITRLEELPGLARIRLGSLEPRLIDGGTARTFSALVQRGKLCPHFHLSLQSGCDETLRRMNRHYTTAEFAESVALLRAEIPRPAVTTDVITGFPGETDAEFEQTCSFLREIGLYEIHVFPYSMRQGTVAAGLPGQVPRRVKEMRSAALLELTARQAEDYRAQFVGEEISVLLEQEEETAEGLVLTGHTERYVKAAVRISENGPAPGTLVTARAKQLSEDKSMILLES